MKKLLLFLALSGCAGTGPEPFGNIPLRNPTAPIASQVNVTVAQMVGNWRVAQGAGIAPGAPVIITDTTMEIGQAPPQAYAYDPQGRYALDNDRALWLFWLDTSGRTAVMGDPDGTRVWIMDRGEISPDRLIAAREILGWYGYDLTRLTGG